MAGAAAAAEADEGLYDAYLRKQNIIQKKRLEGLLRVLDDLSALIASEEFVEALCGNRGFSTALEHRIDELYIKIYNYTHADVDTSGISAAENIQHLAEQMFLTGLWDHRMHYSVEYVIRHGAQVFPDVGFQTPLFNLEKIVDYGSVGGMSAERCWIKWPYPARVYLLLLQYLDLCLSLSRDENKSRLLTFLVDRVQPLVEEWRRALHPSVEEAAEGRDGSAAERMEGVDELPGDIGTVSSIPDSLTDWLSSEKGRLQPRRRSVLPAAVGDGSLAVPDPRRQMRRHKSALGIIGAFFRGVDSGLGEGLSGIAEDAEAVTSAVAGGLRHTTTHPTMKLGLLFATEACFPQDILDSMEIGAQAGLPRDKRTFTMLGEGNFANILINDGNGPCRVEDWYSANHRGAAMDYSKALKILKRWVPETFLYAILVSRERYSGWSISREDRRKDQKLFAYERIWAAIRIYYMQAHEIDLRHGEVIENVVIVLPSRSIRQSCADLEVNARFPIVAAQLRECSIYEDGEEECLAEIVIKFRVSIENQVPIVKVIDAMLMPQDAGMNLLLKCRDIVLPLEEVMDDGLGREEGGGDERCRDSVSAKLLSGRMGLLARQSRRKQAELRDLERAIGELREEETQCRRGMAELDRRRANCMRQFREVQAREGGRGDAPTILAPG